MKELELQFIGTGEVKNVKFTQVTKSDFAYIYLLEFENGFCSYEVFERKTVKICLDFEGRIYSDTDLKVQYPKSNDFGIWAWCFLDKLKAEKKYNEIIKKSLSYINKTDIEIQK
jgi:hypothetical protein